MLKSRTFACTRIAANLRLTAPSDAYVRHEEKHNQEFQQDPKKI